MIHRFEWKVRGSTVGIGRIYNRPWRPARDISTGDVAPAAQPAERGGRCARPTDGMVGAHMDTCMVWLLTDAPRRGPLEFKLAGTGATGHVA